jgi:hypothetical protein
MSGIKVSDLSRFVPSMRLFMGRTPFSWDGGMITPVREGVIWGVESGRIIFPWLWFMRGRTDWRDGVTWGVLAQSVNGIPRSLFGRRGGVGFGGAGRREGGLLEGLAMIWFFNGLPWRTVCWGRGGRTLGWRMGDSFLTGAGAAGGDGTAGVAGWGTWSLILVGGGCWGCWRFNLTFKCYISANSTCEDTDSGRSPTSAFFSFIAFSNAPWRQLCMWLNYLEDFGIFVNLTSIFIECHCVSPYKWNVRLKLCPSLIQSFLDISLRSAYSRHLEPLFHSNKWRVGYMHSTPDMPFYSVHPWIFHCTLSSSSVPWHFRLERGYPPVLVGESV